MARALFPAEQARLQADFMQTYFQEVPKLVKNRDIGFAQAYAVNLIPRLCTASGVQSVGEFLRKNASYLPPVILKKMRESHEEDERCVKVRKLSGV